MDLRREIPRVRRARGWRLGGADGRRWLDLWQADGAAILGHRAARSTAAVKAALDRGLAAALPTAWEGRLLAALAAVLPGCRAFRLYATFERALRAAADVLGAAVVPEDVADPGLGTRGDGRVGRWRPFLPDVPAWPVAIVTPPCALGGAPVAVAFREAIPPGAVPSDTVAGAAAVAALRGLAALGAAALPGGGRVDDPFGPRDLEGAPGWERRGPYVAAAFPAAAYPGVFRAFLERGVLLAPRHPGPSILPGAASPGERRLVATLFRTIPGGSA